MLMYTVPALHMLAIPVSQGVVGARASDCRVCVHDSMQVGRWRPAQSECMAPHLYRKKCLGL